MNKKILLVDLDDTVWGLLEAWVAALNEKYNLDVDVNDCYDWDMHKLFTMLDRIDIDSVFSETSIWDKIQLFDNVQFYLKELNNYFEIYFVSATHPENIIHKIDLIKKYFPFIDLENNTIFTKNKSLIHGDYLIDDNINNLISGDYKGILMNALHNRNIYTNLPRFDTWEEIYEYLMSEIKNDT